MGQMEADDALWRPLKGAVEVFCVFYVFISFLFFIFIFLNIIPKYHEFMTKNKQTSDAKGRNVLFLYFGQSIKTRCSKLGSLLG